MEAENEQTVEQPTPPQTHSQPQQETLVLKPQRGLPEVQLMLDPEWT